MPLVAIYPLPSSLPQPSLGCSRPSAHPPPGRISGRGQGPAEHCWSGLGLKLFPPSPEVQLACPQAQGQLPCLTTHTTEPKHCPSHPTLLHLLPSSSRFLLPASLKAPFPVAFPSLVPNGRRGARGQRSTAPMSLAAAAPSHSWESSIALDAVNGLSTGL